MRNTVYHIVIFLLLLLSIGCGVKGDPFPSVSAMHLIVEDLTAGISEDAIILSGLVSSPYQIKTPATVLYRIEYAWYSTQPCEECPIDFRSIKEGKITVSEDRLFTAKVIKDNSPGFHYYRVVLINTARAEGSPSNNVKIVN